MRKIIAKFDHYYGLDLNVGSLVVGLVESGACGVGRGRGDEKLEVDLCRTGS